jgi:SAM-dependent methyltransferase
MGTDASSLADRAALSGEHSVAPLLARAKLIGLPTRAARALEFPCGLGVRTAAIAERFEEVVGIDPSADLIESAAIMHRGDPRCSFVAGGVEAIDSLHGTFDLAYADLRRSATSPGRVAAALVRALAPDGMLVVSVPPPRRVRRLLTTAFPSRHPINVVRSAVATAGGRTAWIGRGEGGSMLVYARAAPRALYLVGAGEK